MKELEVPIGESVVKVHYNYSYDPGVWTYPNGDPGYPPSCNLDIVKIIYKDVDITNLIFGGSEFLGIIEETILTKEGH